MIKVSICDNCGVILQVPDEDKETEDKINLAHAASCPRARLLKNQNQEMVTFHTGYLALFTQEQLDVGKKLLEESKRLRELARAPLGETSSSRSTQR